MANKEMNLNGSQGENHEIGRDLYNRDKQYNQDNNQRRGNYRGDETRDWGSDNFFHTGPNRRGAQDRDNYGYRRNDQDYPRGGASHSSYNQGQNAHLNDHYGSRSNSSYRNERSYINHGDGNRNSNQNSYQDENIGSSQPGNFNEPPRDRGSAWRDTPGGRSRYKETDYRYGSGSHNWYRENRYTPDDGSRERDYHDDRGFFQRMKDGWNDIMHSDDPGYNNDRSRQGGPNNFSNERNSFDQYRSRNFDRGYENGPRWADESDSGHDDNYGGIDRSQRLRR